MRLPNYRGRLTRIYVGVRSSGAGQPRSLGVELDFHCDGVSIRIQSITGAVKFDAPSCAGCAGSARN